jgi:alkaline phosphatase
MARKHGVTRREAFGLGIMGGLSLGLGSLDRRVLADDAPLPPTTEPGAVKNIIFMVADGMSLGVPTMAEPFSHIVRQRGTAWYALLQDAAAVPGFFETTSLNSLVTDSSAASSAWGSGARVFNGAVNVLPDGTKLTPIAHVVAGTGRRIGLVTTTTITHATPAGFASVSTSRDDEQSIARQYLDRVDVLMGGGRQFFEAKNRTDEDDLLGRFVAAGYTHWDRRAQVTAESEAPPARILGLFTGGHLPYTVDWRNQPALEERIPTLAEMTRAALRTLAGSDKGFLLQIEGGRVDHAAHANDAAGLLWDQLAFDDAVAVALEFTRARTDTLLVITSDHGNANPGLNGMGGNYRDSAKCFERLAKVTASYDVIGGRLSTAKTEGGELTPDAAVEVVRTVTGIEFRSAEAQLVCDAVNGKPAAAADRFRNLPGLLGQVLSNHTGVGWIGMQHTSDLVLVTAVGAGAGQFHGIVRNCDAFERLLTLIGVQFRNPTMTPEDARQFAARAPRVRDVHWA